MWKMQATALPNMEIFLRLVSESPSGNTYSHEVELKDATTEARNTACPVSNRRRSLIKEPFAIAVNTKHPWTEHQPGCTGRGALLAYCCFAVTRYTKGLTIDLTLPQSICLLHTYNTDNEVWWPCYVFFLHIWNFGEIEKNIPKLEHAVYFDYLAFHARLKAIEMHCQVSETFWWRRFPPAPISASGSFQTVSFKWAAIHKKAL